MSRHIERNNENAPHSLKNKRKQLSINKAFFCATEYVYIHIFIIELVSHSICKMATNLFYTFDQEAIVTLSFETTLFSQF